MNIFLSILVKLGKYTIYKVDAIGRFVLFFYEACIGIFYPLMSWKKFIFHMKEIGYKSFLIIFLASASTGTMFGIQFSEILIEYRAEALLGAAAALALSKEIAPILGAFIVIGKSGSAMAAEIANMRVNQEFDAMKVMGVDPFPSLISPRILACIITMPMIYLLFLFIGVSFAYGIGVIFFQVDQGLFFEKIAWLTKPYDIFTGAIKSAVFGLTLSLIGCYKGFYASSNAKGVGQATTSAVVNSLLIVLISGFFISYFF